MLRFCHMILPTLQFNDLSPPLITQLNFTNKVVFYLDLKYLSNEFNGVMMHKKLAGQMQKSSFFSSWTTILAGKAHPTFTR